MKKRIVAILLCVVMAAMCACGSNRADEGETTSVCQRGLDVVSLMDEMVSSKEYVELFSSNDDIKEIAEAIAADSYDVPTAIYRITISPEEAMVENGMTALFTKMFRAIQMKDMSEELKNDVNRKLFCAITTQINAGWGDTSKLAAAAIFTTEATFIDEEIKEDMIYVYVYKNAAPIAVTFIKGDGGAVSATGTYLLADELCSDSEQDVVDFFEAMGAEVEVIIAQLPH